MRAIKDLADSDISALCDLTERAPWLQIFKLHLECHCFDIYAAIEPSMFDTGT